MTIINQSHKFVFVHVPKVAGTSITKIFSELTSYCDLEIGATEFGESIQEQYKNRFGLHKHSSAKEIKNIMGQVEWSKFMTFGFVRNPFDRVKSTYKFLLQWEGCPAQLQEKIRSFVDINEYILSDIWSENLGPSELFRPQSFWLTDQNNNRIIVDLVTKLEDLQEGLDVILRAVSPKLFHQGIKVSKLNSSKREDKTEILSKESIEKILKVYKKDFEVFNYDKYLVEGK
jgi:hypothetical protein